MVERVEGEVIGERPIFRVDPDIVAAYSQGELSLALRAGLGSGEDVAEQVRLCEMFGTFLRMAGLGGVVAEIDRVADEAALGMKAWMQEWVEPSI